MDNLFFEDNKIVSLLVLGVILLLIMALTLILFFYLSRKKIIQKELEKKSMELKHREQILQASITILEKERKRIAQDLHDAISSKLNVISLTTHVLLDDQKTSPELKSSLEHILDVTTNTLESARKIAHDLMPPILDKFGLNVALEELFEEFTSSTNIQIDYQFEELSMLSKVNELHLFRIVQELINNSLRHGQANEITLIIERKKKGFFMCYQDNGIGFEVAGKSKDIGIGLQSIKSRIAILKANLEIKSTPGKGSTFIINSNDHG